MARRNRESEALLKELRERRNGAFNNCMDVSLSLRKATPPACFGHPAAAVSERQMVNVCDYKPTFADTPASSVQVTVNLDDFSFDECSLHEGEILTRMPVRAFIWVSKEDGPNSTAANAGSWASTMLVLSLPDAPLPYPRSFLTLSESEHDDRLPAHVVILN